MSFVSSRSRDIFCNRFGVVPGIPTDMSPDEAMINLDGEDHTCQRGLVSKGFTPRRTAALEANCAASSTSWSIAWPSAANAIWCGLRAPAADAHHRRAARLSAGAPGRGARLDRRLRRRRNGVASVTDEVMENFQKFCAFHEEILAQRQAAARRRSDQRLARRRDRRQAAQRGEAALRAQSAPGRRQRNHAPRDQRRNARAAKHPEDVAFLREHPQAIPNAVEEMIRWTTPFVRMQRTLLKDHEMYGTTLKEGDKIVVLYPAANRDPASGNGRGRSISGAASRSRPLLRLRQALLPGRLARAARDEGLSGAGAGAASRLTAGWNRPRRGQTFGLPRRGLAQLPVCFTPVAPLSAHSTRPWSTWTWTRTKPSAR